MEAREHSDGQIDADEAVRLADEAGMRALDVSEKDKKRLQRLR